MGGGIRQYALYRAEDGSLCLFSLVIAGGAQTPVHDHLAWGLIGVYRGVRTRPSIGAPTTAANESAAPGSRSPGNRPLKPGEFYTLIPPVDDIHFVETIWETPSIWIHLLANDTACVVRHRFDAGTRRRHTIRSGLRERALTRKSKPPPPPL